MLADMILLVEKGTISGKIAKTVMEEMYKTGKSPAAIVEEKGLLQISNSAELETIVDRVMTQHADAVAKYRSGNPASMGFLVGQVMKATQGRANPQTVNELLRKRLAGEPARRYIAPSLWNWKKQSGNASQTSIGKS